MADRRTKDVTLPNGRSVKIGAMTARQFLGFGKKAQGNGSGPDVEFDIIAAAMVDPPMTADEAGDLELADYLVLQREIRELNGLMPGALPLTGTQSGG